MHIDMALPYYDPRPAARAAARLAIANGHSRPNPLIEMIKYGGGAEGKIDKKSVGGLTAGSGRRRKLNGDAILVAESELPGRRQILLVGADGLSGNGDAPLASDEALNVVGRNFANERFGLLASAKAAHRRLMQLKHGSLHIEAGTTIVAGLIDLETDRLEVVHLGDSRAYLFRGDELSMLTRDHDQLDGYLAAMNKKAPGAWSPTFREFKRWLDSKEKLPDDPERLSELMHDLSLEYDRSKGTHRLTEALGSFGEPAFSHLTLKLQRDDWFIICSDGVHKSCKFRPLKETIAANRARRPYQLSTAITRMVARELGIRDDVLIGACHYV
jgi:serine/threonine protein phosphatase PrpC